MGRVPELPGARTDQTIHLRVVKDGTVRGRTRTSSQREGRDAELRARSTEKPSVEGKIMKINSKSGSGWSRLLGLRP